jgi:2-keto-4-pentenoate hydratase/2-oxohepta-3-ene-1,7-dioic acid hydratase in catechol pathway
MPSGREVVKCGSGVLLAPTAPLLLPDPEWGLDFESELAVVLGDVAQGTPSAAAGDAIRLWMLVNDVTYRNLVPPELQKGFGFFASKPATASPGPSWRWNSTTWVSTIYPNTRRSSTPSPPSK